MHIHFPPGHDMQDEGHATLSQPPPALKLSCLDEVPKQHGKPVVVPATDLVPAPAAVPAPAPAPMLAANPSSDLAVFASILNNLMTAIHGPVAPPPPAADAAPSPNPTPPGGQGDENDDKLDFPAIFMEGMTTKVLKEETGFNIVDVLLLQCLAKALVCE
ncbi:hypothetical protein FRC06_009374, partial [Ceratobasidium sp. 370]